MLKIQIVDNTRSELTKATAAVDALYRYGYDFDDIGNRKTSAERGVNSAYAANWLNQYTAVADGPTTNLPTSQPSTSHPSTPQLLFYTHDGNKKALLPKRYDDEDTCKKQNLKDIESKVEVAKAASNAASHKKWDSSGKHNL